jgi:hypothetical protein
MSTVFNIFDSRRLDTEFGGKKLICVGCNGKNHAIREIYNCPDAIYDPQHNQEVVRVKVGVQPAGQCDGSCKRKKLGRSFEYFYPQKI